MQKMVILGSILLVIVGCTILDKMIEDDQPPLGPESDAVITGQEPSATRYHYSGDNCADCHDPIPQAGGPKNLKHDGDYNLNCKCHIESPGSYVHPVDFAPDTAQKTRISADLPLDDGKLTCLTCHDIYRQCRRRPHHPTTDRYSLRGGPYSRRADFCYKCHPQQSYLKLNPHNQFNAQGELETTICLYCHVVKPDEKRDRYEDVKLIGNFEILCQRCHMIRGSHSGNSNHLIKPSAKALAHMQGMEQKFGIILPLDPEGKMTCATCHNPHDKGVIPAEYPSAKGAGSKYRHRLPGRLCIECHQK